MGRGDLGIHPGASLHGSLMPSPVGVTYSSGRQTTRGSGCLNRLALTSRAFVRPRGASFSQRSDEQVAPTHP
jgi:hypothetical protein